MSVSQIQAGRGLTPVYPNGYQDSVTVFNTSSLVSVYLSDRPGTDPTTGWVLGPQASVTWNANRPLFIGCATGQTALVQIIDQELNGWDPGAIAAQLIDQNLPTLIGNQIALQGAPPLNSFATVFSADLAIAGGNINSGTINAAGYQSLDCTFIDDYNSNVTPPTPRRFDILWSDGQRDTFWITSDRGISIGVALKNRVSVPVRTPTLIIIAYANAFSATLRVNVTGSYRQCAAMTYKLDSDWFGFGGSPAPSGTASERFAGCSWGAPLASTTLTEYIPVVAGPAAFTYRVTLAAGGVASVQITDVVSGRRLASATISASSTKEDTVPFVAPNRPIAMAYVTGSGAVTSSAESSVAYAN